MKEKDDGNCYFDTSFSNTNSDGGPVEADAEGVNIECSEVAGPGTKCIIGGIIDNLPTTENSKPLFLSKRWRECLCRCGMCSHLYAQRRIGFLLDKEDSIAEYERMAEQKWNENIQKLEGTQLNFLNDLGHVEKMEVLRVIGDAEYEIFSLLVCLYCSKGPQGIIMLSRLRDAINLVFSCISITGIFRPLKAPHNCRFSADF